MRSAGILLPVTSLPSPWGVGTMGAAAREFVDFLHRSGQSYWQILPICPTGYGNSPYQSFSSFAGNPYLIDLDALAGAGLLRPEEYRERDWGSDPAKVDYGLLYKNRYEVLRIAAGRYEQRYPDRLADFCREQAAWLEDYALFMALKDHFHGAPWSEWSEPLRRREPQALDDARRQLAEDVRFWRCVQAIFFEQWESLKAFANQKGVRIIGDLPFYVSGDSADVWADPGQFQLDGDLRPVEVAGCPPDGFAAGGQLWGNPLFAWDRMKAEGYAWWMRRIAFQLRIYDVLRIDHFRGFDSYYAIPRDAADARGGRWRPGPGIDFFREMERRMGRQNIIAEDLGFLTPSVRTLLARTGYPGMKVLELAFDSRDTGSGYLPHTYPRNCVVYTGTHDNDTVLGWMAHAPQTDVAQAVAYLRLNEAEGYHWGMMRSAWASVGDLAIMQLQDLLGLGSEARINTPSTIGDNWTWRCAPGIFTQKLAARLRAETALYERLPAQN